MVDVMWVLNFTACQLVSISCMPKVVGSFAETTSSHLDVDLENEAPICKLTRVVLVKPQDYKCQI